MSSTQERIAIIRDFPAQLEQLTAHLTSEQLTTPYNAPEWTIAQNIHHVADSHMNAFMRCKLTLTQDHPTVKGYLQGKWALLPESTMHDVAPSLAIISGLHARWVILFNSVTDWTRTYYHDEYQRDYTLDDVLTTYSNHGHAHLKQIREVMEKM